MKYQTLIVTTALTALLVYNFPRYLTVPRVSRTVLRFLIVDAILYIIWNSFIHPFFFSPLRKLPGPTVQCPFLSTPFHIPFSNTLFSRVITSSSATALHSLPLAQRVPNSSSGRPRFPMTACSVSALSETEKSSSPPRPKPSKPCSRTEPTITRSPPAFANSSN